MPYQSTSQQRWAHATDQPFAKRWDKLTDFATLPKRARRLKRRKESATAPLAVAPHGYNALFNQPGQQGGKRGKRMKRRTKDVIMLAREKATGAPGELISPGVRRIRGNLCNVHGKYGPCDKALSGKKPAKGRKPAKPKKIPQTPAERAQARDTQHQANIASVAQQMANSDTGLSPSGAKALTAFAKGQQPDATQGPGLAKMGLAEQAKDGSYRLTPTGHAVVSAMSAGDYQRAVDAISRGTDNASSRTDRATARQARTQAAADKRTAAQTKREAVQARRGKKRASAAPTTTTAPAHTSAPRPRRANITIGAGPSVKPPKTPVAPKAPAASAAPAKQIAPALQDAAGKLSAGTASDDEVQSLIRNGLAKLDKNGDPVLTAAGLSATKKEIAQFITYKDSSGRDRWLSITTSAYQDTDREWISTKAIAKAVEVGDATGARGPLRYWHVPGMDIGDCDFQAAMGPGDRFLVESGTFRNKACADLGRTLAQRGYQMSPGFLHARDQPHQGVFDDIVIYERSTVPAGRAANRFTRFTLKEDRMLTAEKETELRGLLADQPDLLNTLLSQVDKTDKAAQAAGVTHKEAEQPPAWATALIERMDKLEATTKATHVTNIVTPPQGTTKAAAPPFAAAAAPVEGSPEEEATEPADEALAEGDDTGDGENMLTGTEVTVIANRVIEGLKPELAAMVAQIMGALDLEKKVSGHVQGLMAPYAAQSAQKDDTAAKLAAEVETIKSQLKDVAQGNLPESLFDTMGIGTIYRPSQARVNHTPAEQATIKEAINAAGAVPSNLTGMDADAYKLIYGA